MNKKILILGHCRHGKDSLAEIWNENFGLTYKSSSQAAAEFFIFNHLKEKYGYNTIEECFNDRVNKRKEWHELIVDYNKNNRSRLAEEIINVSDCYVGMRNILEMQECVNKKLFDIIIWVDASNRLPLEDIESFNIDISFADIIIPNNDTFENFKERAIKLGNLIFK